MKTKKVASSLPLLAGIGLGIVSLTVPFLLANHYIWAEGVRYSADNYLFFFWGKYYTVAGTNTIESRMITYDFGDFPMYAMVTIIIGLIMGLVSMFAGRGLILSLKGREVKLKLDTNPVWLQTAAVALVLASYLYMNEASKALTRGLEMANYVVEYGPSFDFLLGSLVAFVMSTLMTAAKFLKSEKSQNLLKSSIEQTR